jgi:hypothetical protein
MSAAQRQKAFRKRTQDRGMVDIRLEIPVATRDKVKAIAKLKKSTMKQLIQQQIAQFADQSIN